MSSSNRHWPSMFKSKPCNSHHQWQHDINSSLISSGCNRTPYTSVSGCEERTPEPKPRWNPKPEQIRILEAIFNSGMVNPPRDEIRKIRAQLQEYGQVGDANVFYWFQNRKSRSKHKLRHLQNSKTQNNPPAVTAPAAAPSSSSSSSSEKSSPKPHYRNTTTTTTTTSMGFPNVSVNNQTYFQSHSEIFPEPPFFFPVQQTGGFSFSELSNVVQVPENTVGPCTSLLLSEIINHGAPKKDQGEKAIRVHHLLDSTVTTHTLIPPSTTTAATVSSPISQIQGVGELGAGGPAKSTVFINDVAFEVAAGPFNVREAFGDDAVLIHSSGQPVLTNEWGVTVQSLQHGAFYYLI